MEGPGQDCDLTMKEIASIYRMLPPLLKTVQEQTNWIHHHGLVLFRTSNMHILYSTTQCARFPGK